MFHYTRERLVQFLVILCVPLLAAAPASSETVFQDDFESGTLQRDANGVGWFGPTRCEVSTERAKSGNYSLKFHYPGSPDLAADAWSELSFRLPRPQHELWIKYDLYVPANYEHRAAQGTVNNKLIRLGIGSTDGKAAGERNFIGGSTYRLGDSTSSSAIVLENFKTLRAGELISSADSGQWINIIWYYRADTHEASTANSSTNANDLRNWETGNGSLKIWKNGKLIGGSDTVEMEHDEIRDFSVTWGYLMGWANSGFSSDTDFFIDNVVFSTSPPDELEGLPKSPADVSVR